MRKGVNYIIKNAEPEEHYQVIDDLYDEAIHMSRCADYRATAYKSGHVFGSIFITIAGAIIAVLAIFSYTINNNINNTTNINTISTNPISIVEMVLGSLITIIKSLLALFSIEKRSYLFKESAIKLRKISRDVKLLKTSNLNHIELAQKLEEYYMQMDEMDVRMFNSAVKNETDTVIKMNPV